MLRRALLSGVIPLLLLLGSCGSDGGSAPSPLREGRTIYGDTCSVCHGDRGQGLVGPALDVVTETWPTCTAHVEWIEVGSEGWLARHGETYGATERPVEGGMPAHGDQLTLEQMRLVAVFERVAYGGQAEAAAIEDCQVGG